MDSGIASQKGVMPEMLETTLIWKKLVRLKSLLHKNG